MNDVDANVLNVCSSYAVLSAVQRLDHWLIRLDDAASYDEDSQPKKCPSHLDRSDYKPLSVSLRLYLVLSSLFLDWKKNVYVLISDFEVFDTFQ